MRYIPRAFAPAVIKHIIECPRCNIWLDPGLGKTGITLSAFDILWIAGSNKFPVLVIAPKRVARSVWSDEVAKFSTFSRYTVSQIIGNPKQRLAALDVDAELFTINYENLPWLIDHLAGKWPFKSVVADESTNLKGFRLRHGGKRAAALSKAAKFTARWVNLSGTPAPNGLIDLWGQMWFIDGGKRLGTSYTDFKRRWFKEDKYAYTLEPLPHAQTEIMDLIADVTYSLTADDCMDLDPIINNTIYVDLSPKVAGLYKKMERDLFIKIGEEVLEAKTAADLSLKCLQMASGAVYKEDSKEFEVIHNEKLEAVRELLSELQGNPLLLCYHFKHDIIRIKEKIPGVRLIKSKQDEDDWNDGKIQCGLIHPASAGHGLNLQHGGHHMAFFSHWWNLEHYMQVIDRIGPVRQEQSGYQRRVVVHHIVARNTIDETVMIRRETKRSVQALLRERVAMIRKLG